MGGGAMEATDVKVLVVDDDPAVGKVLGKLLAQDGVDSVHVPSAAGALAELARAYFDLVITDLKMPGMDGLELLRTVRGSYPETPVVLITAYGTVPDAVEAMKAGALDFILKPFERDDILRVVRDTVTVGRALGEDASVAGPEGGQELVEESPRMRHALAPLRKAAPGNTTVLLRGESGVGKDVAAHLLHDLSGRRQGPFIKIHCAGIPETLLESELFGTKKGAASGAIDRPGRVELAAGGTLFLDEIGDLTPAMQLKLLELLEPPHTFQRLGDTKPQHADVRIVAATHRDLESRIRSGEFREDLFYRLNVIPVWIPPLRERREEIPGLVAKLCTKFAANAGRRGLRFAPDAVELLGAQPWPGNVRQLKNFVERLTILSDGPVITRGEVEGELCRQVAPEAPPASAPGAGAAHGAPSAALEEQRSEAEKAAIARALDRARGNKSIAARILGISRRTLYNKMHLYGMLPPVRESSKPLADAEDWRDS